LEFWSCVLTTFLWCSRLDNREREKKDWEREKFFVCFTSPAALQQREREKFLCEKIKFLWSMPQWMNERRTYKFFYVVIVVLSCVLRDYYYVGKITHTQILKKKKKDCERKKEKCMFFFITWLIGGPLQRERERISVRNKNETFFKF
jgi:hypothetical protein